MHSYTVRFGGRRSYRGFFWSFILLGSGSASAAAETDAKRAIMVITVFLDDFGANIQILIILVRYNVIIVIPCSFF